MAANKPFANLDNLSKRLLPTIPPFEPKINQGPPVEVVNTLYADQLGLGNRFDQPSYRTTNHLAQFFLSDNATGWNANTKFRTSISLGDRLDQPDIGTTNHLSQFFLSDVFTGVITIKPVVKDTEPSPQLKDFVKSIKITQPSAPKINGGELPRPIEFQPTQGTGEEPTSPVQDISTRQGIIIPDSGEPVSGITILFPQSADQKLAQQGVVLSGGALQSSIYIQEPIDEIAQGGTDINPLPPSVIAQGGTNPTPAISQLAIQAAQGIIDEQSTLKSAIQLTDPVKEVPQGIVGIGSSQQSIISITLPTPTVSQGFVNDESGIVISTPPGELKETVFSAQSPDLTTPSPEDSLIRNQGIVLNTLGYTLGQLALVATPTLIQGGELPQNELPGEGGHQIVDIRAAKVSALLNPPAGTSKYTKAQLTTGITDGGSLAKYDNAGDVSDTIQYVNVDQYAAKERQQTIVDLLNSEGDEDAVNYLGLINPDNTKFNNLIKQSALSRNSSVKDLIDSDGQLNKNSAIADALGIGGPSYPDLSADDGQVQSTLTGLLTTKISNDKIKDYKKGFNNKNYKFYTEVNSYSQIIESVSKPPSSDQKRNNYSITIAPVEGGDVVVFDAFIKTFSDSLNVGFTDFNHVGQQDTFKVFKGTTRQIGLGFTAVAMPGTRDFTYSDMEAKAMLTKINKLMTICGVGDVSTDGNYVRGPIIRIQIAGLVTGLICACGSVKVDVPIDENTWDIDTQLPHMYDISLDLAVLAMEEDKLLNKKGKFYNI